MVPPCSDRISRVPPYSRTSDRLDPYGAITRFGPPFQTVPVFDSEATGLVRVRSSLLTESRLMSFPPATEIFQFAGFASPTYGFSRRWPLGAGFPHSEISGSTFALNSPELIAECHVLHRLPVPRHPPNALLALDLQRTPTHGPKPALEHRTATRMRRRRRPGRPLASFASSYDVKEK